MKRVAVFGNAGAGKSTLARQLADITGLPLYALDLVQFKDGVYRSDDAAGGKISDAEYERTHAELIQRDRWIIDGYGSKSTAWARFDAADTLIYVDLPLPVHYWWVLKRLIKGAFVNPEGWPVNSPVWSSSLDSLKVVMRCHRHLTPKYRELVASQAKAKRVYHLRSAKDIRSFRDALNKERGDRNVG